MAKRGAVEATVTGKDQQVGFRALVMKQAIEYNLAGSARNDANEIVRFTLRKAVQALDPCVSEEFLKLYVAYKAETNFVGCCHFLSEADDRSPQDN